ncbi:MAG TPA: hypothetical protein DGK91_08315 [Clostridium sp.]|jgi:hypothetical protein|nr:hypothetical protein [Clostridia bacterium]HCW04518.1 hypothetical protein [Clostridium sp.]
MYSDIYEIVSDTSNTVSLVIHEKDYFLSYEDLTKENAQDLAENYFKFKGRDGVPVVTDINRNANTGRIQVTVKMEYERDFKLEPAMAPDVLNKNRHDQ